jgi:hypothetical protein
MNLGLIGLPIFILLLLLLAVPLLFWRRRLGNRAPRPRHGAVRIICGLGAVAILVAMTVVTWRETQVPYRQPASPASRLHLPAKPLPELPAPTQPEAPGQGAARITPLTDARLLAHLVFLQDECPVYAEDLEIRMPEDAGKKLERIVELAGVRYTVACTLSGLQTHAYEGHPVKLQGIGECSLTSVFPSGSSSGVKGGNFDIDTLTIEPVMFLLPKPPWSLTRTAPVVAPRLIVRATLVHRDDPLREVSLEEFAAVAGAFPPAEPIPATTHRQSPDPSPAFRMLKILGPAMLLLLLAAALLAQVFARRGLAFAGTLACVLLYAALLDRLVLAAHARRLADADQPVAVRCLAVAALPGTVFYQTSAKAALTAAAQDPSAPAALRAQAAQRLDSF